MGRWVGPTSQANKSNNSILRQGWRAEAFLSVDPRAPETFPKAPNQLPTVGSPSPNLRDPPFKPSLWSGRQPQKKIPHTPRSPPVRHSPVWQAHQSHMCGQIGRGQSHEPGPLTLDAPMSCATRICLILVCNLMHIYLFSHFPLLGGRLLPKWSLLCVKCDDKKKTQNIKTSKSLVQPKIFWIPLDGIISKSRAECLSLRG